jgi:FtsP/CotA-like multicopper oxidase with cupredoxin domain
MITFRLGMRLPLALIAAAAAALTTAPRAGAVEYYLRAEQTTVTLPDPAAPGGTRAVPMWGFARDTAFGAMDGTVTVPGPVLRVPPGDNVLTIHLDNNLADRPVSLIIPGQTAVMTPVRHPASAQLEGIYAGRVRSLTHETPPGNAAPVSYTWANFRPGTFIYHSATHPAVQVQMGLYGGAIKDAAAGQAQPGQAYDAEVLLFHSSVDPDLHDAVAGGNYGPDKAVTSPINFKPRLFLINGRPFSAADPALPAGSVGQRVLLRFFNTDYVTRAPMLPQGGYMRVIAEDGFAYGQPATCYSLTLEAMKTKEAIIQPSRAGLLAIMDRTLALTNGRSSPGGMMVRLAVGG